MDRYARGGFNVGYENRVDVRQLRAKRIAEAHEERRKAGLDALLVWKDENQRYLTDLRPQLIHGKTTALNGALLIEGHDPILFCSGGERDRSIAPCRGSRKSTPSRLSKKRPSSAAL